MNLLLLAFALLVAGAFLALLTGKRSAAASLIGSISNLAAGGLVSVAAVQVLLNAGHLHWSTGWSVPAGRFALQLDPLAAFFLLPIALVSACAALFGRSYMHSEGQHRALASHWFFYNLMVVGVLLVVTAANAILFLAAWEIMTLSSFFLVAWDHHLAEVRKAAWLYLQAAHCGLMLLLALFVLAGVYCNSFNFSDFAPLAQLAPPAATLCFLLALFGFGVKAGLIPLHIWLPDAHPAAPSHVSAVMSGVLVKTGIYGILRLLSFLPPAPAWWGWLIALLGVLGALYGISLAAQQADIKRCLAYSTIENLGVIFLGLGFGLAAAAEGHPTIALLAYAGGLLHLWNHALFKGLMFLGAGTLVHATGTRDMNLMGGLLKRMPLAGLLWIAGGLAISALPPLNGLVSEWLIYLSLGQAGTMLDGFAALTPLLLFGLLGLVGSLTLLTFSRLIGICLLGEPRSAGAAGVHEAEPPMLVAMALLLSGCLTIGLYPQGALHLLAPALRQISGLSPESSLMQSVAPLGHWGMILLAGLALGAGLLLWLRRLRPAALACTWGCSFRFPTPRMAYSGEGFSEFAAWHLLPKFMRPTLNIEKPKGPFPNRVRLTQTSHDPVLKRLLLPLFVAIADRCQRLRWVQQGQLSLYLLYIFITSTVLMIWSLWAGRPGGS
jgi:formate hydrogenlyase subunit 3/multisubunit Na+/H+ antiporter MnhD subunit